MIKPMDYNKDTKVITLTKNTGITISLSLLLFFATLVYTATARFTTLANQIQDNTMTSTQNKVDIVEVKNDAVTSRVQLAEIQTQLKNIDVSLTEIKQRLQ